MKTTTLLAVPTSPVLNKTAITENLNGLSGKNVLRHAIQAVLMGSVLVSGVASAVLQDHGPSDPVISFPSWYRDTEGLALGLCRSTTDFCFPLAANPAGFPGNIGDEAFYSLIEFKNIATGSDFQYRYLGALEASYLPGPTPKHGDETVFARIRITFNFNDVNKNGTYTIIHPYGVHTFENVEATNKQNLQGAQAANYFTVDVPMGTGFDGALAGPVGPFIQWDTDQGTLVSGAEQFVGNPTIEHTFIGSPFGTNYFEIQGPAGSNLDGLEPFPVVGIRTPHDTIRVDVGMVLGQKWTAPISQNLSVQQALMTRNASLNSVDVWATSGVGQTLLLTGAGMPSLKMLADGAVAGKYHGHVEYSSATAVPASVKVINLSSVPVVGVTAAVKDMVEISAASFNAATGEVAIVAHSSDEVTHPKLVVQGVPGVASGAMTQLQCATVVPAVTNLTDVCYVHIIPARYEVPESVSVISALSGSHADHLISTLGNPQNPASPPVATNFISLARTFNVGSSGVSPLTNTAAVALPLDAIVIQQPTNGMVELVNGLWQFTATAGAPAGVDSFLFVRNTAATVNYSNVATGNLKLTFNASGPQAVADKFASFKTGTTVPAALKFFILANDKPASTNVLDVINPGSVTIVNQPTRGTVTKNLDGSVTYQQTVTGAGTDTFSYNVTNSVTPTANVSNIATATVSNFAVKETVTVPAATVKYTIASKSWTIKGQTNWFGVNLPNTTATCWTGTLTAPTVATLIGKVLVDATGGFTVVASGGPVGANRGGLRCATTNGGLGAGVITAK